MGNLDPANRKNAIIAIQKIKAKYPNLNIFTQSITTTYENFVSILRGESLDERTSAPCSPSALRQFRPGLVMLCCLCFPDTKVFISPYGLGEFSGKDYEAMLAGCLLVSSSSCQVLRLPRNPLAPLTEAMMAIAAGQAMGSQDQGISKHLLVQPHPQRRP